MPLFDRKPATPFDDEEDFDPRKPVFDAADKAKAEGLHRDITAATRPAVPQAPQAPQPAPAPAASTADAVKNSALLDKEDSRTKNGRRMLSNSRSFDAQTPGVLGASRGGTGLTPKADWRAMFPGNPETPARGGAPFRGSTPAEIAEFHAGNPVNNVATINTPQATLRSITSGYGSGTSITPTAPKPAPTPNAPALSIQQPLAGKLAPAQKTPLEIPTKLTLQGAEQPAPTPSLNTPANLALDVTGADGATKTTVQGLADSKPPTNFHPSNVTAPPTTAPRPRITRPASMPPKPAAPDDLDALGAQRDAAHTKRMGALDTLSTGSIFSPAFDQADRDFKSSNADANHLGDLYTDELMRRSKAARAKTHELVGR